MAKGYPLWTDIILPEFEGRKCYVTPGSAFYSNICSLMATCGFKRADTVEEADVVVFGGGADINPKLYGEKLVVGTFYNDNQDTFEVACYNEAIKHKKVMFGICRGAQFLHAMNGGKLYQDVDNHGGSQHLIVDMDDDVSLVVNSLHHQMLIPSENLDIIAVCADQVGKRFVTASETVIAEAGDPVVEVEAGYYHETRCFFVQGHPEVGSDEYRSWTMGKLYDFLLEWEEFDADELVAEEGLE